MLILIYISSPPEICTPSRKTEQDTEPLIDNTEVPYERETSYTSNNSENHEKT